MPLDATKISLAVEAGLSIMCATCTNYWAARDRNIPGHRCTVPKGLCGSPLAGMDFPLYEGPITNSSEWCFVCGSRPSHLVMTPSGKVFAICEKHIGMLDTVRPADAPYQGTSFAVGL
jgi:hypothetical protein